MPRFKDNAVCLRHVEFSETSQVVVLLTERHGKVRGLAKGARRLSPSSMQRFSGGVELLTLGQVVATTKRTAELATITEWDLQDDLHHFRDDLGAQRLGLYAADVTHAMLADLDPHPAVFAALVGFLSGLADLAQPQAGLLGFQWALLDDAGYRPVLDRDVHTDAALPKAEAYTFDAQAGGFTADNGQPAWRVRHATLQALRQAEPNGKTLDVAEADARRANRLLCSYLRELLGRELPTMGVVLG